MAATCQLLAAATGRGQAVSMTSTTNTSQPAAASGTFAIGGDLPVARLGFGTMRLPTGTFTGPVRDPEDGIAVLRRAVELGVNHIDTASFYRRGDVVANELVRRALAPYPDGLVIATKVGPMLGPDGTPTLQATPGQLRGLAAAEKPYRPRWDEVYAGPASRRLLVVLSMPAGDGPFNSLKPLGDLSHVRRHAALGGKFQD